MTGLFHRRGEETNFLIPEERKKINQVGQALDEEATEDSNASGFAHLNFKYFDAFSYRPVYQFQGYRSGLGAFISILLIGAVMIRMVASTADAMLVPPVTTEARYKFERDGTTPLRMPEFGVVFKKQGWRTFYDESYFTYKFEQGTVLKAGNVTWADMEHEQCSFVDMYGRIMEDQARCPIYPGQVLGTFFDETFMFVKVSMVRCYNGTLNGKPKPGPCRTPEEIDKLIWEGTVASFVDEVDLSLQDMSPVSRLKMNRRQFMNNIHISSDFVFLLRTIERVSQVYFDRYDENNVQHFLVLDTVDETMTNFRSFIMGKWNKPDPEYVPSYATFFYMLGQERALQKRTPQSIFGLMESWGSSFAFFYIFFRTVAHWWNTISFAKQVKGLDLRDLEKSQFNAFGRLVDKSFQMPLELQDMEL